MFHQNSAINIPDYELADLASEVGICWDSVKAEALKWTGQKISDCASLRFAKEKSYRGKVAVWATIKENGTALITFYTLKHGGRSVIWSSKKANYSDILRNPNFQREQLKSQRKAESERDRSKRLNQEYIQAYKQCREYVSDDFPYFIKKKIENPNLKLMTNYDGKLFAAIPMLHRGQIVGLERLFEDGSKKTTPGEKPAGRYSLIGAASIKDLEKVFVCDGWADAKTINNLTKTPTICTFSNGNLPDVINMLLNELPAKNITIAADNDQFKDGNTGLRIALEMSYHHKIKVRYPNFEGLDIRSKPTDFNDLYVIAGSEETIKQLTKSRKSILRSGSNALDFRLRKLSLSPKITSPNNKLLKSVIYHLVKNSYNREEIIQILKKTSPKIPENSVFKCLKKFHGGIGKRVAGCHTVLRKKHKNIKFIDLPLTRQAHGGYLIDENFFDQIKSFNGIVVVDSPMASGKTETILSKAIKSATKACYLAHRIGLTEEAAGRLGIESYRDVSTLDMHSVKKLASCINSLNNPKFEGGDWFVDCDIIAIDEATKVLQHLTGKTIDDPDGITLTLLAAIENASQVIMCDADANSNLIDLLDKLTNKPILVATASPKMDHVDVTMSSIHDGFSKVFTEAMEGKKVLVACDSKKDVKKIKRKLDKKGLKVLAVHSESKIEPEVEQWTKNPNKESHKWDVIAYNSTVDSGISITSDHFDVTVGLFRGVVSPQSIIQMMGRDRTAREWFIGCSPIHETRYGDTFESRYKALAASSLKVEFESGKIDKSDIIQFPKLSHYDVINLSMQVDNLNSYKDYFLTLRTMLDQKGYKTSIRRPEESLLKELTSELKELGDEIDNDFIRLVNDTTTPQAHVYRRLKQAHAISEEELAQIVRYEIRHNLGIYAISLEDIIFWLGNHDRREQWYEIMRAKPENLLEYDKWQKSKSCSLSRRKHLKIKADILHKMFEILGLNRETGEGSFNHTDCGKFIDYIISNQNRLDNFNYYKVGPHLDPKYKPKIPTIFVQRIFEKMGLSTKARKRGRRNLAYHELDAETWKIMDTYHQNRLEADISIAHIPFQDRLEQSKGEQLEESLNENQVFSVDPPDPPDPPNHIEQAISYY